MGGQFKENWKRLANRDGGRYGEVGSNDVVRFNDHGHLTTNASGLNGISVIGAPTLNQVLKYDGNAWVPKPDALGSGIIYDTATIVSNHVIETQNTLLCDAASGSITVELAPASSVLNMIYYVKKIDNSNNPVIISGVNSETIDGVNTLYITNQYDCVQFISDGSSFFII